MLAVTPFHCWSAGLGDDSRPCANGIVPTRHPLAGPASLGGFYYSDNCNCQRWVSAVAKNVNLFDLNRVPGSQLVASGISYSGTESGRRCLNLRL